MHLYIPDLNGLSDSGTVDPICVKSPLMDWDSGECWMDQCGAVGLRNVRGVRIAHFEKKRTVLVSVCNLEGSRNSMRICGLDRFAKPKQANKKSKDAQEWTNQWTAIGPYFGGGHATSYELTDVTDVGVCLGQDHIEATAKGMFNIQVL